ncbi:tetratricopeptide repeat protein [Bdellovibrio sp. 22V]|uniref:tetratricopeptide repeat protein n=1 Tax=Bdellovibrio TaxID=958 RepID=UPI002542CB11|nr:tetratricopeptide repeat protein [Bdellovibrio sp. 22V]WII72402.1 tetratricopeptide repeat protein [Bdellovibrio sp. 22V]
MNTLRFVLMAGCLILGLAEARANKVNGVINFQGDTVHLELMGQQNWDYDVKRVERKGQTIVEMTVPAMDDATIQSLASFKSDFIQGVSVDRKGPDGKHIILFTLSGDDVDTFDYLTDQPSRLIVDFYLNPNLKPKKENKTVAQKEETKKTEATAKPAKTAAKVKTDKARKPATADALTIANQGVSVAANDTVKSGIFDGGDPDYDRFSIKDYEIKEEAMIRAKDNYYIPFPMLETPVSYWEKLKVTPTIYQISPQQSDENKQARLLLTLFEKQRYGVFLKTREWFQDKYPQSQYNEVVDFMTADVHLALWQDEGKPSHYDEALQKYKEAIQKYPKSPLAERTSLKIGYLSLERGDYLGALRLFKEHIDNKNFGENASLSKDLARLGMGLAYMKLNKWQDAVAQFDEVEKTSTNRDLKVEGAFRRGDVWVRAKNYKKAVEDYQTALKKYPEGQNSYPNAYYNQAESLFWMNKYNQSLDVYRDFVKKFPSNDHAPFAMTRMGELLEIFGADKSRVMGSYLETYFRYGESPSAVIARLRLLSARMKGMKPKEVNNAVGEIMSLAKKIDLPNIEQFATVMVADGYSSRGEQQKAIDLLSKYYKEHPTSVDVPLISNRIVSNINDKLQTEVDSGNFIRALKTHSQYADTWLKNSKRLDTKYNVGRAFEMGGAPNEAEKYYKDVLNRVYAIRGTPEAREIQVKEEIPSEDELNLRLAAVFTQEHKYNQAYENLKNIKTPEKLSEDAQIERVNIAVRLLEKRGDNESAIRYLGELLRTWKGQPELVAEPYLKLAELQLKQERPTEALQALEMIDKQQKDSKKVAPVIHAKALEMMGDIYMQKGQVDQAITSYDSLLETYEESRPLSSIRYKLGQIYFKRGEIQKAAEVWNDFKGEKSAFWKNLAQEQLKNSEWRDGYKKYIKRIPAMSENEQGK